MGYGMAPPRPTMPVLSGQQLMKSAPAAAPAAGAATAKSSLDALDIWGGK
jgi:hypothetical protein